MYRFLTILFLPHLPPHPEITSNIVMRILECSSEDYKLGI
jgi:hypothetical protein